MASAMLGARFPEILAAAAAGEQWAVAALWRDVQPALLRYLRAGDPVDGEDITSDVWVEAARGLDRFRGGEADFRAWMFTIARHRLIDARRRAARRRTAPVAWLPDRPGAADTESDAIDALGTAEAVALIGTLPPDQAEVVLLRVVAGLDVARVARIMGKRPGTIRVLQHRGLRALAARLAADAGDVPAARQAAR